MTPAHPSEQKPSERLHLKRRLLISSLLEASQRFWNHPQVAELFPHFRFRMFWMSHPSVSLLNLARERSEELASEDPVAAGLIPYWRRLAREEANHDVWHLEDLEALGISREEVLERIPPATIVTMVGAQYYWIRHYHPVAFLGFMAVAESYPPSTALVNELVEKTSLPLDAFRYYSRHAILEPHHNQYFDEVLDALPLTKRHWSLIGVNMARSAHLAAASMDELIEEYEEGRATPFDVSAKQSDQSSSGS